MIMLNFFISLGHWAHEHQDVMVLVCGGMLMAWPMLWVFRCVCRRGGRL